MKAAGIPSNASGLGGFVNGAPALVTPALVMVAAIAPLALIAGGIVLLFGREAWDADRRHDARGSVAVGQRDGADRLSTNGAVVRRS